MRRLRLVIVLSASATLWLLSVGGCAGSDAAKLLQQAGERLSSAGQAAKEAQQEIAAGQLDAAQSHWREAESLIAEAQRNDEAARQQALSSAQSQQADQLERQAQAYEAGVSAHQGAPTAESDLANAANGGESDSVKEALDLAKELLCHAIDAEIEGQPPPDAETLRSEAFSAVHDELASPSLSEDDRSRLANDVSELAKADLEKVESQSRSNPGSSTTELRFARLLLGCRP